MPGAGSPRVKRRGIRFRSVVHSDILSERPATLSIIVMERPIGNYGMLMQFLERTCTGPTVRVNNEASPCV